MQKNRVIIAGGRDFECQKLAFECLDGLRNIDVEIVCGGARGADALGEYWATVFNKPVKYFPADWDKYGKAAGHIRNKQMAEYGTHLIAFWDGKSKGTKNMIENADRLGLSKLIIIYEVEYEKLDCGTLRRIYRIRDKYTR